MLARLIWFAAIATLALASAVPAQSPGPQLAPTLSTKSIPADKPPVPPGRDPGGIAIALIGTGIDYTLPHIAPRLARDGEGELIGWDLHDRDRRPFDQSKGTTLPQWGGDGTQLASLIIGAPTARLVPVRVDPSDPVALANALAFVAQTPARVAVVAMGSSSRPHWEPFRQAAQRFKDVLVLVPAGPTEPIYPAALGLDNVLAVAAGTTRAEAAGFGGVTSQVSGAGLAVAAAASAAAELRTREPALDAAALKRRLGEAGFGATWRPEQEQSGPRAAPQQPQKSPQNSPQSGPRDDR
jgi:hypothetical protein